MKKPLLAGVGVVGACAACCAIPLALPILSGLSAAGLAGALSWHQLSGGAAAGLAIGVAAAAGGVGVWLAKRGKPQAPTCALPGAPGQQSSRCGCGAQRAA